MKLFRLTLSGSLLAAVFLVMAPVARAESLTDVLIAAYRNSNLLEQNRAVLRAADEDVAIAISTLRPTLNFLAQASYADRIQNGRLTAADAGFLSAGDFLTGAIQLSADLTLYDYGRNKLGIAVAKEAVLATRDGLVGVEQSVLLAKKLKALSVPTRLTLTDGGHAFTLYPDKVDDLLSFFDSVPALKGRSKRQP